MTYQMIQTWLSTFAPSIPRTFVFIAIDILTPVTKSVTSGCVTSQVLQYQSSVVYKVLIQESSGQAVR